LKETGTKLSARSCIDIKLGLFERARGFFLLLSDELVEIIETVEFIGCNLEQNQQNKPTFIGGKTRKKYYKKSKKYTRK
jgi:hypothetical protein